MSDQSSYKRTGALWAAQYRRATRVDGISVLVNLVRNVLIPKGHYTALNTES